MQSLSTVKASCKDQCKNCQRVFALKIFLLDANVSQLRVKRLFVAVILQKWMCWTFQVVWMNTTFVWRCGRERGIKRHKLGLTQLLQKSSHFSHKNDLSHLLHKFVKAISTPRVKTAIY